MNTATKVILGVLAVIVCVAIGFAIASLIQDTGDQSKEITFSLLIKTPGDYTITMGPVNPETGDIELEVTKGQPAIFTIATQATGGWDSPIWFEVDGLPEGTIYEFATNPVNPGETTALTIQTGNLNSNSGYVLSLTAGPQQPE